MPQKRQLSLTSVTSQVRWELQLLKRVDHGPAGVGIDEALKSGLFFQYDIRYSLILDQLPLIVGIVFLYFRGNSGGLFAKIGLIYVAVLIDDKRHNARLVPVLGPGHERKTVFQTAAAHVIHFSTGRGRALPRQDFKKITMEWLWARAALVAFRVRLGDQTAEGRGWLIFRGWPVEAVSLVV